MTRQELSMMTIPLPFAGGANAARAQIGQSSGDSPNFYDGFPSVYSAPKASGGKFVMRSEINGVGYMASVNEWYRQGGGIYTFDPAWSLANGGYPIDAVLALFTDGRLTYVRSLMDNNTWDFTELGVDGIHWTTCTFRDDSIPTYDISSRRIIWNQNNIVVPQSMGAMSENIVMPFDGYINYLPQANAQIPVISSVALGTYNITNVGDWNKSTITSPMELHGLKLTDMEYFAAAGHAVWLCISQANENGGDADDVVVTTGNMVSGERNCAVFCVDGSGTGAASAGCGIIPVSKGSKIKVFGYQTYTRSFTYQKQTSDGTGFPSSETVTVHGTFAYSSRIEAYPIFGGDDGTHANNPDEGSSS